MRSYFDWTLSTRSERTIVCDKTYVINIRKMIMDPEEEVLKNLRHLIIFKIYSSYAN